MKKSIKIALSALLVMILTMLPVELKASADSKNNDDNYLKISDEEDTIIQKWQEMEDSSQNITLGASGGGKVEVPASGPATYAIEDYTTTFSIEGFDVMYNSPPAAKIADHDVSVKAHYDYLSDFYLLYTGSNIGDFKLTFYDNSWNELKIIGPEEITEKEVNLSTMVSEVDQKGGSYYFVFESRLNFGNATTVSFKVDFDSITSTILQHAPVNPTSLTGSSTYGHPDNINNNGNIEQTWEVTGPNGSVTASDINSLLIYAGGNKLEAGDYTVTLMGAGKTINGTPVPPEYITGDSTTFKVRYPKSTTTVDKPINPTEIKGSKTITDSTLGWQLVNEDNTPITPNPTTLVSGTGDLVPTANYTDLPPGKYKVIFTETSPEDLADTSEGIFEIQHIGKVKLEFYIEDSAGNRTPTGTPPPLATGKTGDPHPTSGMTPITHGYELIEVDIDGTVQSNPINNNTVLFPAHDTTTTVKYVYKEKLKTSIKVEHIYEDNTPVQAPNTTTNYLGETLATSKLPGYEIKDVKVNGTSQGNTNDVIATYPATGETTVTYVYKKPPVLQGSVSEKHYIINADGTFSEIAGTAQNHPLSNVGTVITLKGELTGASLPANHSYAPANTTATNPSGGAVSITGGKLTTVNGQVDVKYYYKAGGVTPPTAKASVTVTHTLKDINGNIVGVFKFDGKTGAVNDPFSFASSPLPGYLLEAVPANSAGKLTASPQEVKFVYVPDPAAASVAEIHYLVDANGNILGVIKAGGKVGANKEAYKYTAIPGYTLVSVTNNAVGNLEIGKAPVVIFKYLKTATTPITPGGDSWSSGVDIVFPQTSTTTAKDKDNASTTNPQTGDNTNTMLFLALFTVLLIVSGFVLILSINDKNKRKSRRSRRK